MARARPPALPSWPPGLRGRADRFCWRLPIRSAAPRAVNWTGDRAGVPVIGGQPGSDPGAIVFDALQAAQSRKVNVVLIDTAGRLHTKFNLMQELKKVRNVTA